MHEFGMVIVLMVICAAGLLAHRLKMATSIAFLLAGAGLGFIPEFRDFHIEPEMILIIFLPPILMEAAFFTSLRDFKNDIRNILILAIGLVAITTLCIAVLVNAISPEVGLLTGFLLGAIISPPDAAAATSILKKFKLPRRAVTIVEGESLVNDATGLILYNFALLAITTNSVDFNAMTGQFFFKALVGTLLGLVIGYGYIKIFPRFREPSVELISTFIPPYAAYLVAESIQVSPVLAVVAAGLVIGWHAPRIFSPTFRITSYSVWNAIIFLMNAGVFMLIGLQLPAIFEKLSNNYTPQIIGLILAVCVTTVVVRFIYVFMMSYGVRYVFPNIRKRDPYPHWKNVFMVAWTGMRGIVTLALALAIPYKLPNGEVYEHRELVVLLAVCVILFTLVLQGLTMPWIIKKLRLGSDFKVMQELWHARNESIRSALARIEEMMSKDCLHPQVLERIRSNYKDRLLALGDGPHTPIGDDDEDYIHPLIESENYIWKEALAIERKTIVELRNKFTISDEVMNEMLGELALLESRYN